MVEWALKYSSAKFLVCTKNVVIFAARTYQNTEIYIKQKQWESLTNARATNLLNIQR